MGCENRMGRPEADVPRQLAMTQLGNGLAEAEHYEDALSVYEADLAIGRRLGSCEEDLLITRTNLANCLKDLGRAEESLQMRRGLFADTSRIYGTDHENTIIDAINLADSLNDAKLFAEARSLLRDNFPVARRTLGTDHEFTLELRTNSARAIYRDTNSSLSDLHEAVAISEDVLRTTRRVYGVQHPFFAEYRQDLEGARMRLADDESREAFAAPAPTRRRRRRRRPKNSS